MTNSELLLTPFEVAGAPAGGLTQRMRLWHLYAWWMLAECMPWPVRWFVRRLVIEQARSWWREVGAKG